MRIKAKNSVREKSPVVEDTSRRKSKKRPQDHHHQDQNENKLERHKKGQEEAHNPYASQIDG